MTDIFDISQFDSYREDNRREVKKARDGLPVSLWDTYSAFANCYGGVIILGVKEGKDGSWHTTGLKNASKLQKEFWDIINNTKKVSINLLTEDAVEIYEYNDDIIMVIHVPAARREQKPVFINDDMFGGTFRRNYEGDYHCTRIQVKTMLRDQADDTIDMSVLDNLNMDIFNMDSVRGYRNTFAGLKDGHPFLRLDDNEFLRSIGAAAISDKDNQLHPTAAGLLMFGNEYDIVRQFPDYFLDYRALLDPNIRWTDRINSSSGDWSGNIFDFYFRVYNKLKQSLNVPFKLSGLTRIDDTPMHEAIREALANCLINADYFGSRGIVITLQQNQIMLSNPGYSRTGKVQMIRGGVSDPRNRGLMKMFNLIDIGERAGSGIPHIINIWQDEDLKDPIIQEEFGSDRTSLILSLEKKQAIKTSDNERSSSPVRGKKTIENQQKILEYLKDNGRSKCSDIAIFLNLSEARTRALLSGMDEIEAVGSNRNRTYRIK
ncbi:MAG: putative DNA binding domain-containing protein [Lachnospiraceae bacterium]|nr:putative DNA binding domain-containing protein [Lachnospiraceae bacterium]